jgi:hypothetical protein
MVKLVRESLETFEDFEPGKVERNGLAYTQTQEFITTELNRYLEMYRGLQQVDQTARLIRDQIDGLLRRYHDYVIQGKIQAHYRQKGLTTKKGNVFEHVIPARTVRNLLIQGRISLDQALNSPTCIVSPEANQVLVDRKLNKRTPSVWWFWRRYEGLGIELETYDGTAVDPQVWDLSRHYEYFARF